MSKVGLRIRFVRPAWTAAVICSRNYLAGLLVMIALTAAVCSAQKKEEGKSKNETLEVARFDVQQGVELPPDFVQKLTEESIVQIGKTKKFKEVKEAVVSSEAGAPPAPGSATVVLTGTIVEFDPGSRTKRYLLGMGAGAAVVVAHVRFIDPTTGEVRFERDITAKMTSGVFGGSAKDAVHELARELAKAAKKNL